MKILRKVDLTKEGEPRYTTYFYHKYNKFVFEVITNGDSCALSIAEKCGINKDMKFSSVLPKYIQRQID
jgi:N-acetylglucosamine kinase-like BadF-type ATPase